jgi:hypothetical protein
VILLLDRVADKTRKIKSDDKTNWIDHVKDLATMIGRISRAKK